MAGRARTEDREEREREKETAPPCGASIFELALDRHNRLRMDPGLTAPLLASMNPRRALHGRADESPRELDRHARPRTRRPSDIPGRLDVLLASDLWISAPPMVFGSGLSLWIFCSVRILRGKEMMNFRTILCERANR